MLDLKIAFVPNIRQHLVIKLAIVFIWEMQHFKSLNIQGLSKQDFQQNHFHCFRFGRIMSVVASRNIKKDEEVFVRKSFNIIYLYNSIFLLSIINQFKLSIFPLFLYWWCSFSYNYCVSMAPEWYQELWFQFCIFQGWTKKRILDWMDKEVGKWGIQIHLPQFVQEM